MTQEEINKYQRRIIDLELLVKGLQAKMNGYDRRVWQGSIPPQTIKDRHIDGTIIKRGVAANRPDGTTSVSAYFATDTGVLSIWDGTQWLEVTLT